MIQTPESVGILKPILISIEFTNPKHSNFTFDCTDGKLYHSKFILQKVPYFNAMFESKMIENTTNTLIIDHEMKTINSILIYITNGTVPRYCNLYTLQVAHLWGLPEIIKVIFSTISEQPRSIFLDWDIYFDEFIWLGFIQKLFDRGNLDETFVDKFKNETAKLFEIVHSKTNTIQVLIKMHKLKLNIYEPSIIKAVYNYIIKCSRVEDAMVLLIIFHKYNDSKLTQQIYDKISVIGNFTSCLTLEY